MTPYKYKKFQRPAMFAWLLLLGALLLSACDSGATPTPPPAANPSFQLSPATLTLAAGESASASIVVERNGFTGTVSAELSEGAAGISATVSNPGLGNSGNVDVAVASNLAAGTYTLLLRVQGGSRSETLSLTVVVSGSDPQPGQIFRLLPAAVSIAPGAQQSVTISVDRSQLSGTVSAEVRNAPAGFSSIMDNPGASNQGSVTIIVADSVAPGNYTLSVRVQGGGQQADLELNITVTGTAPAPVEDFAISLSSNSLELERNQQRLVEVTVQRSDDFSGSVRLRLENLPTGVEATVSNPLAGNIGNVLIQVGSNAAAGNYSLRVIAESGSLRREAMLNVRVSVNDAPSDPANASLSGRVRTLNALEAFDVTIAPGSLVRQQQDAPAQPYVPDQLVVAYRNAPGLQAQDLEDARAALRRNFGLRNQRLSTLSDDMWIEVVELEPGSDVTALAAVLSQDPNVVFAEPNYYIYSRSLPSDSRLRDQWYLPRSGIPVAWQRRSSAENIVVAVVDTGIDLDHPDLQGVFVNNGYDFCASSGCASRDGNPRPDSVNDYHGTHVTGIIAAAGNNNRGIAGVLQGGARIVPVKTFFNGAMSTSTSVSEGIRWAAGLSVSGVPNNANPARIINISLGTEQESQLLRSAVSAAQNQGALVVSAAGNTGLGGLDAPASYDGVLSVGSINSNFRRSCFSNFGSGLDIMAAGGDFRPPGVNCPDGNVNNEAILSTFPSNNYSFEIGTSQAAPLVAGVAALVWAENPGWNATQVRNRLRDSAYFDSSYMTAGSYGAGILRADAALGMLAPTSAARRVNLNLIAESANDSGVATVVLDLLQGVSETFTISNLRAGSYVLETVAGSGTGRLEGRLSIAISRSEQRRNLQLLLGRP